MENLYLSVLKPQKDNMYKIDLVFLISHQIPEDSLRTSLFPFPHS